MTALQPNRDCTTRSRQNQFIFGIGLTPMVIFRRFLVLASLAFWQGGFAFYGSVVVPMGEQVLSSPIEQGFVTRRVTNYLNLAGAVALPLLLWDIVAVRTNVYRRLLPWSAMGLVLLLQVWLHPLLDELLDVESMSVLEQDRFYVAHPVYLIASAFQWFCALAFAFLSLQAWCDPLSRTAGGEELQP